MILELDDATREELERFSVAFTCERCAQFDPDTGACSAEYPNEDHRAARPGERRGRLVFCKEFELA